MPTEARIARLRGFNRFYTEVLGLLRDGLLDSPYSLAESRMLFELGTTAANSPGALADRLQIDPGYVSRVLAALKKRGLVRSENSPDDGRRQMISLTKEGRAAFGLLDHRSSAQISALLDRLSEDEQQRLMACVLEIELLLGPAKPPAVVLRAPAPGDYGWVIQRHGELYAQEYGWDETFEALVARIIADYVDQHDPKREAAWIAEVNGARVGCILCTKKGNDTAQLRVLLVEPGARGAGVGSLLIEECIRFARRAGYTQMVLWTNDDLVDARRLYERAGFRLVDEDEHRSFGHDLIGQNWVLDL